MKDVMGVGPDMGRKMTRRFLATAGLAAAMLVLGSSSIATATVTGLEVSKYARHFDLSHQEARRNLVRQSESGTVTEALMHSEGKRYAGVWFDNQTGEFVAPTISAGATAAADKALSEIGVEPSSRTVKAVVSWEELEGAHEEIDRQLLPSIKAGYVATSLDPRTNAVVVEEAAEISDRASAEVAAAKRSASVPVEIRLSDMDSLDAGFQSCGYEYCSLPLRGGVNIYDPSYPTEPCTAGFPAMGNDGNRYLLTAGHCVGHKYESEPDYTHWWSKTDSLAAQEIGSATQYTQFPEGDWAKIKVSGSYWDTNPWRSTVVYWGAPILNGEETILGKQPMVNAEYPINGESPSVVGVYACHSGIKTGTTCGSITGVDVTHSIGSLVLKHMNTLGNVCSSPGDSGGPVFAGNSALGMLTGSDPNKVCNDTIYYSNILEATQQLGVQIGGSGTGSSPPIPVSEDNTTGPRVLATPGGTVETYFRSTSGKLGHQWYVQGSGWGVEEQPGSMAVNAIPRVTKQGSGITDVFFRTASNELGHDWWAPGIGWGNEVRPDSVSTDPTVVAQENGTVDIFYRTASGELGHDSYVQANGWSHEVRPASIAAGADPVAIGQSNGTVDIFWRESNGYLGHHSYVQGSGWAVQTMAASIAQGADPVVQNEGEGTVAVYFRTTNNELGHYWYRPYIGWSTEIRPGPIASDPQVTYLNDGTTNIFFRTPNGELGHEWWVPTRWEREIQPVQMASAPHVTSQQSGVVDVFYRTPSGELGHAWYVPGNGWGHEVRFAQMGSDPHPVAQENGTVDIFWRTTEGTLGHHSYVQANGWTTENRPATMGARPPLATTGAASSISTTGATLNGTVNPERSPTTYYFQYGTTTSYGSKVPASAAEAGSAHEAVAVSQSPSGLSPGTTYHYRLVTTNSEGTTYGGDQSFKTASTNVKAGVEALPLIQPFDASTGSQSNFASKWATLGWAAAKGVETTSGWGPSAAFPNVAGTYYTTSLAAGKMPAASVVMNVAPGISERYFSLWIDTGTPTSATRNGYEARVTYLGTSGSNYSLVISRWQAGTRTILATLPSTSYLPGAAVALVDEGSTLSLWGVVSGSAINMLNATDSTFSSGYVGLEAAGNITRLGSFKAGGI
jgi:hypothetical protein